MKLRYMLCCLLLAALPMGAATLGFGTLPSVQGWTYVDSPDVSEGVNVTLGGGVLGMNTMGEGDGYGWYQTGGVLTTGMSYMVFQGRLLSMESGDFGFGFGVYDGSAAYVIGLSSGEVKGYFGPSAAFDTSVFHTYVLAVDHDAMTYTLTGDGNPLLNGPGIANVESVLAFGDLTSGGNGSGELTFLSYGRQAELPPVGEVPEPGTLALTGLGAAAVWLLRKR